MIASETKTERTVTDTHRVIVCDLCGKDLRAPCYEVSEVEIRCEEGSSYPEGTDVEGVTYDCCTKCFEKKVAPALAALGLKPRAYDRSY